MGFKRFIIVSLVVSFVLPAVVSAQVLHQDEQGVFRAEVLDIVSAGEREVPGVGTVTKYQKLEVEFMEGPQAGEKIMIDNDLFEAHEGQTIFVNYLQTINGERLYSVAEPDRRGSLALLVAVFIVAVVALSGWQGVRALLSLAGSFLVIIYVLLPQLLSGASPVIVSGLVAIFILAVAIVFTHGANRESAAAFAGTALTVAVTSLLAYGSVRLTSLSGFSGDEMTYLNLNTGGTLDFQGLLLGAIIIGVVGVLDDIAVTQAATVSELHHSAPGLSRLEVYSRALRVGREHVGALVNTLVFAYTGAALPLLLLFSMSATSWSLIINRELFAMEIVRTIVGSIGLVLTVPVTTWIAVWFLYGKPRAAGAKKVGHVH